MIQANGEDDKTRLFHENGSQTNLNFCEVLPLLGSNTVRNTIIVGRHSMSLWMLVFANALHVGQTNPHS
jgi:hypothetical protein